LDWRWARAHALRTLATISRDRWLTTLAGLAVCAAATSAAAQSVEEFYRGKTITMIVSTGVGNGFDTNARLVARHLGRHIPGNPTVIVRNMPGAGHVLAANYMATDAPRDGTTMALVMPSIITHQLLDGRGVRYDIAKFQWLGASDYSNQSVYVWSTGVKTFAETMNREVVLGATGAGSYTLLYPALMNNLLGTRFKAVAGYKSAKDIDLAMQRGEIDGRAGNYLSTLRSINGDWLRDKSVNVLVQIGGERDPDFAEVPLLTEFAKSDDIRRVLQLFEAEITVGRAFLTTPDVPNDRLAVLRRAFDATMQDDAFRAEARRMGLDTNPIKADKMQAIIREVAATPPELIAMAKRAKGETEGAH
jgi:tripartite-type tricarboxylate transporter receptor subunit TctC